MVVIKKINTFILYFCTHGNPPKKERLNSRIFFRFRMPKECWITWCSSRHKKWYRWA